MSGAEAIIAIQLIDACIGITNTIIDIGRAVHDAQGLPPKLRELFEKLPAIQELLEIAQESCEEGKVTEHARKNAQPILKQCEEALAQLRDIFRKACPKDGENRTKRIWRGAKTVFFGRDSQVQKLLVAIQDDLRLLEQKEIYVIGDKLDALQQVTETMADNEDGKYTHTGAGNIIAIEGGNPTNYIVGGSYNRQVINPGVYNESPSTYNYTYLPPERLETPPKPSSNVPFPRDPDFVDRGTLLDQIRGKCAAPASRIALVGLGGVGKSQLAIEHCYRTAEKSPDTWVFWVHASNASRFEQSYRDIANLVKVPGRQGPKADIFQLVHDWLQDERKGRWLLILDNVDDASVLLEARNAGRNKETSRMESKSWQPLISYLPQCQHGSVLVTTRSRNTARGLVDERDIVTVEPMETADALSLLQKRLGQQEKSEEVAELAAALECMALAMVQAAAYIVQRRPRYSVQQYLTDFRKSERKRMALFDKEVQIRQELRRDWEAKNSIIITWQISFNYIRETRPSAADLLSLMSFFDRQGIPEELLRAQPGEKPAQKEHDEPSSKRQVWEDEDSASQSSAGHDGFEDDVQTLRDYSFISTNTDGSSFEMHGLVQLATRKWLQVHDELEQWKQRFVSSLCATFPTGDYESWAVCQRLFAHAKSAAEQRPEREDSLRDWASLLYRAAWYALSIGNWDEAEAMSLQSTKTRRKILGVDHEDTLSSMGNLALTYWNQGRWPEAEALEVQVMETRKRKLGAEHPDTLASMANLASTYWNQGRWPEAEALQVQVMEMNKKLRADHPDTLTSMANLASTYWNQGRLPEAEALEVQVMETRKKKLGANHPDTLMSMNNLAFTLKDQGFTSRAISLLEDCCRLGSAFFRPEHPNIVSYRKTLATWQLEAMNLSEQSNSRSETEV